MRPQNDSTVAWGLLLQPLAQEAGLSKQQQIIRLFSEWIVGGKLPAGARLPSTRELSSRLATGRNTVFRALNALVEQGYVIARERSGIFVADLKTFPPATIPASAAGSLNWQDRFASGFEFDRFEQKEFQEGLIPFLGTGFDVSLFPTNHWRECERQAMGVLEIAEWGRDMLDGDDPGLVRQLRTHILPRHGIWAREDEILVTLGGQEARYLVARMLGSPRISVGIENPCLPEMARVMGLTGARLVDIEVDQGGAVVESLGALPDVVILSPGHQYPTTSVMSLQRRRLWLEAARASDSVVVEDSFEIEVLQASNKLPTLKSMDDDGRVIFIGTLCRQMAPGLRIGYLVAPAAVIDQLRRIRRLMHRHTPGSIQRALSIFIEKGYHRAFLSKASLELGRRGEVLEQAAGYYLPEAQFFHQRGTSSFWCKLPVWCDADHVVNDARQAGVLVEPGSMFFRRPAARSNFLRLSVASITDAQIVSGIRVLAKALAVNRKGRSQDIS